ncbi:class I SAM-dependent methyltransferase, partial [Pseudoxanthomonas taiwanensis]|uniref:class I SAM-dependent methyltransferase n=1 Tax=Pseudoxanthomonas taiwanensis TaxID=176598 RepID=UPI0021C2D139
MPRPQPRPLSRDTAARIASSFLPGTLLGNRYHYYYARAKLRSDPLYPGVCAALRDAAGPLLDLGCGIGLLAHALQHEGIALRYFGVDNDHRKIASARRAAARAGLVDAGFEALDLSQALQPQRQAEVVDAMVAMLEPGAKLVIRTGLDD